MSRRHEDAVVFVDTYGYALIEIPQILNSPGSPGGFAKVAEKRLTIQVVLQRFNLNCERLIEEARRVETGSVAGYSLKGLPYTRFGTLRGKELLLREVESDWGSLLHAASSLEDMICNLAVEWSMSGLAWLHCAENATGKDQGKVPSNKQRQRLNARTFLRHAFEAAKHKLGPLEWVSEQRNLSTHQEYFYACVIQSAGEVVFTYPATDYVHMNHRGRNTLTAKRLIRYASVVHNEFLMWFIGETELQAKATLTSP